MKNRDSVITTLDILVVFSIHTIIYSAFDITSLTNILSTRSNSIHCIEENIYSLFTSDKYVLQLLVIQQEFTKSCLCPNINYNISIFDTQNYNL